MYLPICKFDFKHEYKTFIKQVFVTTNIMYNNTYHNYINTHNCISGNISFKMNVFKHCTQEHPCSPYVSISCNIEIHK